MACCHSEKKTNSSSLLVSPLLRTPLLLLLLLILSPSARAVTYDASADGDGFDLYEAMDLAQAGDTVNLQDGTYDSALVSVRDGEFGSPITVSGGPGAIIKGSYSSRSVLITHSFITLKGFTVEGKIGTSDTDEASWVNKCVYVEGPGSQSSAVLDGFVMEDMIVQNCGGECVRLKDSVVNAQVMGNTISNCGVHDYMFNSGDKNGEGVYIGTSSTQWTNGEDTCNDNLVSGNRISTSGNECVDIKEGASGNVIEDNICSEQLDAESGCYDSRGDGNTFRYNVGTDCMGAGVRLGGWEVDGHQYGVGNSVYGNDFNAVGEGALKVLVGEQGDICGNTCEDGSCSLVGDDDDDDDDDDDVDDYYGEDEEELDSDDDDDGGSGFVTPLSEDDDGGEEAQDSDDDDFRVSADADSDDDDNNYDDIHDDNVYYYYGEEEEKLGRDDDDDDDDGSGFVTPLSEDDDDGGEEAQDSDDEDDFRVSADADSDDDDDDDFRVSSDSDEGSSSSSRSRSRRGKDDDEETATATTTDDDYSDDYGDRFDSDDDESARRDRRRLRGGAVRAS
ncbi:unnamed protein product [Ectocarpus sp. 6 AP-2014]